MIKKNTSFIVLYTKELAKTIKFYETIGAQIVKQEDTKCVVSLGDFEFHFCTTEPVAEYQHIANQTPGGGAIYYIEVEDLEKQYDRVHQTGTKIRSKITTTPWKTKEFLFEDLNGYNIIFYTEI